MCIPNNHTIRRAMAATLAIVMALSLSATALAASPGTTNNTVSFPDVNDTMPGYEAILYCASHGIVSGYSDGTYRPGNTLSAGAFVAILSRTFFPDSVAKYNTPLYLSAGTFYPNLVAMQENYGLTNVSFADFNSADVNLGATRYDMAQLMTNIMNKYGYAASSNEKNAAIASITDYNNIPSQYRDAVANVYALGIIGGYANGSFSGTGTVTRQVGAIVLYRMLDKCDMIGKEISKPNPETPVNPGTGETGNGNNNPTQPIEPTPSTGRTLANGKAITEANVTEILNQLKTKYPQATDFRNGYAGLNSGRNANKNCIAQVTKNYIVEGYTTPGTLATTAGCGGWAAFVADEIFGQTGVTWKKTTIANARPGDLMIILDDSGCLTHVSVYVSEVTGFPKTQKVYSTAASNTKNANGENGYHIGWSNNGYPSTNDIDVYTAYPD